MSPIQHGTVSGYKYAGCRCSQCRAASVRYEKGRRWLVHQGLMPTVPAHGFTRRVHALMAIGWTQTQIAEELGIAQGNLMQKLRGNKTVRRATHEAMLKVYERHCMTPQGSVVALRTARIAAKRGWPPPLAWNDIDDPNEQPRGWQYSPATRLETFTELVERGVGVSELCRHLGLTRAALQKWAANNGLSAEFRAACGREHNYSTSANGGAA